VRRPRTLAASVFPALAIALAWSRLEAPRRLGEVLAVAFLGVVVVLAPGPRARAALLAVATVGAAWIAFGAQPWELLPFRDERVLGPLVDDVSRGVADFYRVGLPFDPGQSTEMHALVLVATFGFAAGIALCLAAARPGAAMALVVAGVGWPATLIGADAVALGALALAAALSIPVVLRAGTAKIAALGAVAAALVVAGSAWAASATAVARQGALAWETWNVEVRTKQASVVSVVWRANYDGVRFPPTRTVVLTVQGPERAQYWRADTLDSFAAGHWFADHFWNGPVDRTGKPLALEPLTPRRAADRGEWLEQKVEVEALVDERLVAAGTPVALDGRGLGTVFQLSGGPLRAAAPVPPGSGYRVWSYAPDPAPAALAAVRSGYRNQLALHSLILDGRLFPPFGEKGRDVVARARFSDPSYARLTPYGPIYDAAKRVTRSARSPYEAVLALESWFRTRGGFRYSERPPHVEGVPPLVAFVTRTRAGYCQTYAGAMALMLRMLGIPSRVAVGFTSGRRDGEKWIVTDHEAHAWVEVWFPRHGWVPFDPTPGRGTFAGTYSFASESEEAIAALRRGELRNETGTTLSERLADAADVPGDLGGSRRPAPSLFGMVLALAGLIALAIGLGKLLARKLRYLSRDPRRRATASRLELEGFLRDQGIELPRRAVLEDLRRALARELDLDGRRFLDAVGRARFGRLAESADAASFARSELRRLLRTARTRLSGWERAKGFVSLRSVRSS